MTRLYIAKLSHENFSLAFSEFKSILTSEEMPFNIELKVDEFVIFEVPELAIDILMKRAGLLLELGNFIDVVSIDEENAIEFLINTVKDIVNRDNYCLEVDSVKGFGKTMAEVLVQRIGSKGLCTRRKKSLGMKTLKISFIVNLGLIYEVVFRRRRKMYEDREPHRRPCYRPGTMKPTLARVYINLSKVSTLKHETVLDPFCGVGGFAIEACLMGLKTICSDIDKAMIGSAKINTEGFNCSTVVDLIEMDAGSQALASSRVDGIATDPPYGIQSTPWGEKSLENLLFKFIESSYDVLRKERFMVFATPLQLSRRIDKMLKLTGFDIVEKHLDKVHGSLTRVIYVVKKFE